MAWLSDARPTWPADGGLLPVVVQDATDGTLLMLAWANREALERTQSSGEAHFWSRSRGELWRKGATSGNVMRVAGIAVDCDGDALLYRVRPVGPACHTGRRTCFDGADAAGILGALAATIRQRRGADPAASYTASLLAAGAARPGQKVIEEAGETVVAALTGTDDELAGEAADLVYHLLVLLAARDVPFGRVLDVLDARRGGSGA
ncbi:MAG: bifunctional phosphoribosyl-AMP cyclohydrolase/phosphoribosyl-ATP diphosphatase HisIE [Chloroflexi bacterium]|nr:bifunctional phosphoribosyl-AMP cyclohydrolase/phosphoribosyl-ATP diphosphatase HisIE [Chloroflexota bacterium]